MDYAVKEGAWEIKQNRDTLEMTFWRYDVMLEEWTGEKMYSHEELYEVLVRKARERRGGKNGRISK